MMATQRTRRPTPRTLPAEELTYGTWTARWGDWVVQLKGENGKWQVTVWRWLTGGYTERTQLGCCIGFASPVDATAWGCEVLRESGARVFIVDKPNLTLEKLLRFNPAPKSVP